MSVVMPPLFISDFVKLYFLSLPSGKLGQNPPYGSRTYNNLQNESPSDIRVRVQGVFFDLYFELRLGHLGLY